MRVALASVIAAPVNLKIAEASVKTQPAGGGSQPLAKRSPIICPCELV
jgi:hypothetical protein